jgi:hypothetical protein
MRVYIAVFALCFIAAVMTRAPYPNPEKEKPPEATHAKDCRVVSGPEKPDQGSNHTEAPNSNSPQWHAAFKDPQWLSIIVAVLALIVIAWQTVATARATRTMRDSVKITVSENRPWLLIQMGESGDKIQIPFLVPIGSVAQAELRLSHCIFFIRNYGQTPARVLEIKAEIRIGDNPTQPPSSTIHEIGGTRYNPYIFPQGESLAQYAELSPGGFVTQMEVNDIFRGARFLWLRGLVRYRHTIEPEGVRRFRWRRWRVPFWRVEVAPDYVTKFCYIWETRLNSANPAWRLAGPSEGNQAG